MASTQKRANSCEVVEEEYEDYEEVEIEEEVEGEDYEEVFEEEVVEEEEIELNEEEDGDEKKVVEVQKVQEEEESVQDPAREEEKSTNPKQSWELEGNPLPLPAVFPSLLQSVSDLEKLHCALSKFLYQWNSLNRSLDLITAAIDAHASSQHDACLTEEEKDQHSEQEKVERTDQAKKKDDYTEQEKEKDGRSCVEILCEEMEAKGLRKYIESNLSDIDLLRHEVPEALRRIPNPEKLVFDAIGKFYTQGRSAYHNNMPFVLHRRASILLLEFFVLSGCPTGDSSVKGEAKHGAFLWWKRLVNENIKSASAVDSLGLVLFLACFGIPKDFGSKDLCTLLLKSNLQNKIDVFRRSSILVEKIPESVSDDDPKVIIIHERFAVEELFSTRSLTFINASCGLDFHSIHEGVIKDLIRGEMYYEAAELSCSFGLTDTFPPLPLLSSFVAKVIQIGKLERQRSRRFPNLVRQADSSELKSLRSVVKFLEDHKFDTHDLASVNIHKRISELEKYIERDATRLQNKIRKRKAQHLEFDTKSEARSKESFSSTPRTPQNAPSQMIQNKPEIELPSQPDSKVENSALSVAGGGTKEHRYGWERRTYFDSSASHRSSAMNCSSAQKFYQSQTSAHGNGSGFSARDLYKFADTVEAQLSKSFRSRNTSPGGAKFGH